MAGSAGANQGIFNNRTIIKRGQGTKAGGGTEPKDEVKGNGKLTGMAAWRRLPSGSCGLQETATPTPQ